MSCDAEKPSAQLVRASVLGRMSTRWIGSMTSKRSNQFFRFPYIRMPRRYPTAQAARPTHADSPCVSYVYWIVSGRRNYIGATVDPARRLRQHNREIEGGARRTHGGVWTIRCLVEGFRTWREALQFEWAFKRVCRRCRTDSDRTNALQALLRRTRWTSNAPLACDVPLTVRDYASASNASA